MAQNRSVSRSAFSFLPNTSQHYEPEGLHHRPRSLKMGGCLPGVPDHSTGEDQHNLQPALEAVQCLQKGLMHEQVSAGRLIQGELIHADATSL